MTDSTGSSATEPGDTERLTDLEIRLAYQDDTIEQLNDVVTQLAARVDLLERALGELAQRVSAPPHAAAGQLESASPDSPTDPLAHERPPHY